MKNILTAILVISLLVFNYKLTHAQKKNEDTSLLKSSTFSGLKFRSIGPAFKSGRIADISVHPENENIWYVAVGSGGVWKTTNAGTTLTPIFDSQKAYSIGCVTLDPNNPHTVWVGTGENIGGRHVGYGDGVYRSDDDGKSWKNMGLKESQHISKIIVHPENSDIIWVAAQGPLWNKGDERGLYKSVDGGGNWKKTLGDVEWVGVTDIVLDPRDPDIIYAATWQRHRNVAAYMGGGPGSGIHKSVDGGETWVKLKKGLPGSDMGKIGIAISPQDPDVLYAAIELDRRTGGVYRSDNRGASWIKMSNTVSGATGPHYYQELYASPHEFDKIYLADVRIQISEDGGKTFKRMNERSKHSDNHSISFKKDDPEYLLIGTDGGIYESFDDTKTWRYISNLPVTQFYKLALDDTEPFYNIYGGTQDNGTQGGLSRTDKYSGISNEDWNVILGADGHQPATEPGNPAIVYGESQQGWLNRIDMTTGEIISIRPQPGEGESPERFNWDSPILVSPHSPTTIFFASQRVWKSENRGDSWTAISKDLTLNQERITLPIMDRKHSWDAPWDLDAMSKYNTITSLAESPMQQGLIYAGTDDGLIQMTEDGGANWTAIEVGNLPDVPETAFVNDIKADLFDANTVYVALDNHKFGDLDPYLLKSTDKGKSWKSIASNIPERTLVWRLVQDHVNPDLLFLATEFGVYFTFNGGEKWIKLSHGIPTISLRDIAIHRRENDLVAASFGRGFYILDDYSLLREISEDQLKNEARLFPVRDTWWYVPRYGKGSQGSNYFTADNPPYGAVFTYYLPKSYETLKDKRKKEESKKKKNKEDIEFPGWDKLEEERLQEAPKIILSIKDEDGKIVNRLDVPASKGFHRKAWNLRYASANAIDATSGNPGAWSYGLRALSGTYTVSMQSLVDGELKDLSAPVEFEVVQMREGALQGASQEEMIAYLKNVRNVQQQVSIASIQLGQIKKRLKSIEIALERAQSIPDGINKQILDLKKDIAGIENQFYGDKSKREIGELSDPTIYNRLGFATGGTGNSYGPTSAQKENLTLAELQLKPVQVELQEIEDISLPQLEKTLKDAGAPVIK